MNFGDDIFENSFPIMRGILKKMDEYGVRPELEIFDKGHLANARRLASEGLLAFPQHVDFVLGVPGGARGDRAKPLRPGRRSAGGLHLVGRRGRARSRLAMAMAAIAMGGHVRVGLEDNLYYSKGRLARNEELVARVARIAEEAGRPVATPGRGARDPRPAKLAAA